MAYKSFQTEKIVQGDDGKNYLAGSLPLPKDFVSDVVGGLQFTESNGNVWGSKKHKVGVSAKAFQTSPLLLGGESNLYSICDAAELGYGFLSSPLDPAVTLLNWFNPVVLNDRQKFSIPMVDYRTQAVTGYSTSLQNILCETPPVATTIPPLGKCTIDFCADPDRTMVFSVNGYDLQAFQQSCLTQPPITLSGRTFDGSKDFSALTEFQLLQGAERTWITKMLTGSRLDLSSQGVGFPVRRDPTGLFKFNGDFTAGHPELTAVGGCGPEFLPNNVTMPACPAQGATAQQIADYYTAFIKVLQDAIVTQNQRVAVMSNGQSWIDRADRIVVMPWQLAQCLIYAQSCLTHCPNVLLQVDIGQSFNLRQTQIAALQDFRNRFREGAWGAGKLYFANGDYVDIYANPLLDQFIPANHFYMFVRGISGAQASKYALRAVGYQMDSFVNFWRSMSPGYAQRTQLLMNGLMLRMMPDKPCDWAGALAFNSSFDLSNMPWLQYDFIGVCPCADVPALPTWPALTPVVAPAVCAPANIL